MTDNKKDYSSLKVLFINTTLKKSPAKSHTEGLWKLAKKIFEKNNVKVQEIRLVDHEVAFGVYPDMTEHGWNQDGWPEVYKEVERADILIVGTPIWLGAKSSVCSMLVERLYAHSADLNSKGQYVYYGKVGGCLVTGNEDGAKACSMNILYSLQHIGYTIPPQADTGWIGEVGPGPSYLDKNSGAQKNDFTNRNTTFMVWNLMLQALALKESQGIPAYGNLPQEWKDGCRFDFENPEYR